MIQISPGDLIAVEYEERFYYVIILTKTFMFGGQVVYAFHRTTADLETAAIFLQSKSGGFHFIADFIDAKAKNAIHRLARKLPIAGLNAFKFFRQGEQSYGLDRTWAIWDRVPHVVQTPKSLTAEQWSYPILRTVNYREMCECIDKKWKPEHDRPEC